ncbi:MAG TPA: formate dehydrogenase subunit delta, partial [Pseudomonadales bacterium]|nr:formate dehydrogenase subunit delta [Pseudomonadales bacterium]HMW15773.1 formate dehydrogenase subunit delta [Pseudomonadales bacterium]HMZ71623.1 formate dehydrogenase subunit delta [Pseudomonadales bacterium]HNB83309.1 formate dehydrogenase subunit delta [Pseudomonadales bacterium]HNC77627.1 formate dehydrogenase subunit delta [Pseudomonadales bacterium]
MANDIATFFAAEPDPAVATLGIESHLRKFWSPRMRTKLIEQWRRDDSALTP